MPAYHKLVRDLIPEIIRNSGKACITHTLDHDAYVMALDAKLDEEIAEYHEADAPHDLEELADILEVLYAVARARGYSVTQLEAARAEKAKERGGFDKRIMLDEVIEPTQSSYYRTEK